MLLIVGAVNHQKALEKAKAELKKDQAIMHSSF